MRDLRPEFGGRLGVVTCLFPFRGPVVMLFVCPLERDAGRLAEWNVAPGDVERVQEAQLAAEAVPVGCYVHLDELWVPVTASSTTRGRTRLVVEGMRVPLEYGEEEIVEVRPAVARSRMA